MWEKRFIAELHSKWWCWPSTDWFFFCVVECTLPCGDGYTNSVPGSPCGCVIPIQVELQLGIDLDTLFPLVSELLKELAFGLFLQPSQVRIVGAKAADQNQEETDVYADFVPLDMAFDNTTVDLLSSRFWNHQVMLNDSLFGSYSVISVTWPGMLLGLSKLWDKDFVFLVPDWLMQWAWNLFQCLVLYRNKALVAGSA